MKKGLGTKFILAVGTLAILAYFGIQGLWYLNDPLSTTLVYAYQVEEGVDLSGYVVRSERVLPDETKGLLQLQRAEGERVSAGGVVALVYADQASLDRQADMKALATRIEQLQYAQEAALGSEVSLKLDAQIVQSLVKFRRDVTANRLDGAQRNGQELRSLVLKRDYTYSETGDLTAQIAELQAQEKALRAQSSATVRRITAPASGLYSAVVDGYEAVLTPAMLKELTPSDLAAIRPDETLRSGVGKLISGDAWYFVTVMESQEAAKLQETGRLTLRFAKNVERDLDVTVDSVGWAEDDRVVLTLRGKTYLPELTLLRQQSAKIIQSAVSGLRIPKEALRAEKVTIDKDGNRVASNGVGVYCLVGAEARYKPVEVLYHGEGFVVVRSPLDDLEGMVTTTQEKLRLRSGDEVIITAHDLYDGKVVG